MASLEMPKEVGELKPNPDYQLKFVDVWNVVPKIHTAINMGANIMLRGPTGTGKTFLVKELANQYGKRLLILNMTAGADEEMVKGRYVVQPREDGDTTVKWIDGQLVSAMKNGYWIVIEEANFMPEELASVFYSVMDDRRTIILDEHENEVIKAHPEYRLFLTGNWGYKGTIIPNDAIRNRIDFYGDLTYLPEREESKLITRETEINPKVSKLISKFAWGQRKIKSRHQPDISTRILIRWASLIKGGLSPIDAGEHTIIALLFHEEKEKEKIRETLKFEFEALEEMLKEKPREPPKYKPGTETPKSEPKVKPDTYKTYTGTIKVGDLVSTRKMGATGTEKYFGIVTRITTSRSGDKVWAFWNIDMGKAMLGEPAAHLPIESREHMKDVELIKTKEEIGRK